MVNSIDKRCITCNLEVPMYNYPNATQRLFCRSFKLEDMIDIENKRCITCNIKQPHYNYPNEKEHFTVVIVKKNEVCLIFHIKSV